jgi:type I restriction enzyme R subunit
MSTTDTSENGFELLITNWLFEHNGFERGVKYGAGEYNKDFAIDEVRLFRFLEDTQPDELAKLSLDANPNEKQAFLNYLSGQITKIGIIEVLRKKFRYKQAKLDLYFALPSEGNPDTQDLFSRNIFSVTRQLQYSKENPKLAVDFVVFLNGLPIMTFELKNQLTKQDVGDAVYQYQHDRDPSDIANKPLFEFKRCIVHLAIDDNEIKMCTELKGRSSWFLPFNKGDRDGAGNPPNPDGIKTDYMWKQILVKEELANIVQNYTQVIVNEDEDTKKKTEKQVFPRYHQLSAVKALLANAKVSGVGQRYLVQHSAGSGKSNSIAWLAHQLATLQKDGHGVFDSIIVVTDRVNLDKQIKNTIRQFMQVRSAVGWATKSGDLKDLLQEGKKIIITIVHKFQYILDDISAFHQGQKFAIIIDEAHSSQSGRLSAKMNVALSGATGGEEDDLEDKINTIIEGKKMVKNASYFAFTATPKNKTLEMFGVPYQEEGKTKRRPFHIYTMKQAIEEGFILDVLRNYMTIQSYYRIAKTVSDDPMFDRKRAQKKLRMFVESNEYAINEKAEIIVEHFHTDVISKGKVGGKARAMVVTGGIDRAIEYYLAISSSLRMRNSPFKAIIAYSGEKSIGGRAMKESDFNEFPSSQIEKRFRHEPYRILVVADKFQTGFDEPLLHTMYVDKILSDISAVQTLSRLNRAAPQKNDTFILDFANSVDDIREAFSRYYKTTILSDETDPNKLNDLIVALSDLQVYTDEQVRQLVELYLSDAPRESLDPILDACADIYKDFEVEEQILFKSSAKSFVRTYNFLAAILPYGSVEWEMLSIFLTLLIPKLPTPRSDDFSEGILETVDLESYRAEAQTMVSIALEDSDAEVEPIPVSSDVAIPVPEMDRLTSILATFHDLFGNIEWTDEDKIRKQIAELPGIVNRDEAYRNAKENSDAQNARDESDRATMEAILGTMSAGIELYKHVSNNPSLKKWVLDMVFNTTYDKPHLVVDNTTRLMDEEELLMAAEEAPPYKKEEEATRRDEN